MQIISFSSLRYLFMWKIISGFECPLFINFLISNLNIQVISPLGIVIIRQSTQLCSQFNTMSCMERSPTKRKWVDKINHCYILICLDSFSCQMNDYSEHCLFCYLNEDESLKGNSWIIHLLDAINEGGYLILNKIK